MRKKIRSAIIISIVVFSSLPIVPFLSAEEKTQLASLSPGPEVIQPIAGGIQGKISLDLRNIEVTDALKFLSMKAGLNVIATKNVTGRVTLMVEDVTVQDVLDLMLRSNGLAYAKQGDIYNVMTEDEYKALFGKKFADIRTVKIFRIKYAIPEQVFSLLDTLKSEIGRVFVEPDSGTALIMDTPEKIKDIENALSTLEQKNLVRAFQLKYAKAKDVEEQLKSQLDSKKAGTVKADERSNQVIVQTLPERMESIAKLIQSLDKKTKEVLIEAKIVKVDISDELSSGVEWEGLFNQVLNSGAAYMGSTPFSVLQPATAAWQSRKSFLDSLNGQRAAIPFSGNTAAVNSSTKVAPGEALHVGVISNNRDFDAVLKYLQTLGRTQILSSPNLAVINNQEAKIHVGERQAYVTTTTTTGQTTTTVSEEVTFVDVGIQLSVTPTINEDGYVTMKVKPEVSSVTSTLITPSGNKIPIIDTSTAETTVMVKDGSTIILGGLREEQKTASSKQLPFLGNIPFLGFMFRDRSNKTERTELLVLLTPTIITGDTLVTSDKRALGTEPGKGYEEYPAFTTQTELKEPQAPPEEKIKPYLEYSVFKEAKESKPTIKGEEQYEIK